MRKQLKASHQKLNEEILVKFHQDIDALREQFDSYLETIVSYCEHHGLDEEDIAAMVGPALKSKIAAEIAGLGLLKDEDEISQELEFA